MLAARSIWRKSSLLFGTLSTAENIPLMVNPSWLLAELIPLTNTIVWLELQDTASLAGLKTNS